MPYSIKPTGSDFEVVNDESGEVIGKHPTRKQALDQQRALYANVPDASAKEFDGVTVKHGDHDQSTHGRGGGGEGDGDSWATGSGGRAKAVVKVNGKPVRGKITASDIDKQVDKAGGMSFSNPHGSFSFTRNTSGQIVPRGRNNSPTTSEHIANVINDMTGFKESERIPAPLPTAEATGSFITRAFDALKGVLKEGRRNSSGDETRLQQIHDLAVANGAHCEPLVFKEVSGRLRWVMFSSNSFQDTDREIVSQAALERDVERTDKERNYGPLRWWHVGNPDKMTRSPGEGIDIGDCDFRATHGRVLIESGTFRNERIGEAIKQRADKLAGSLGFFHPNDQPDSEGVFTDIHTFERSLLPKGRASNPLTALTVTKESQDMATMKEKFEEFVTLLGGDKQLAESVVSKAEQTEKEAQAQGLKFKEGAALPDNATATAPAVVSKAAPVEVTTKQEAEHEDEAEDTALINRLMPMIAEKVGAMIEEKMSAANKETATKEAGVNSKIATLETQLKEARDVIAQLTGDLPRGVKQAYRASQSEATVSETRPAMQTKETANPIGTIYDWLVAPVQGQG